MNLKMINMNPYYIKFFLVYKMSKRGKTRSYKLGEFRT